MVLELDHLTDRELLIRVVGDQEHMSEKITAIEAHSAELNGTVAGIVRDQFFLKGAIAMLAFIVIASLSAAGIAVAVVSM